ncbi:uncharacterized protein BDCG_01345 [Blastomyces dermatitidis ER-3]|uniref:Uncharacterized protein n=1 Tax=Ajellomyces dermatitidis (strain ER-3 / ATCC MYA-2586) TaxID=559297 RepID=A0ABP2EMG9_AJEDR|nr:uncharacterized protein BDCG_01345 [Blastomyces dermatitidis ER-3]EEQ84540.1 hypothetical protein BDCG_01345 [Blastomyces dermatitidis ER-3]
MESTNAWSSETLTLYCLSTWAPCQSRHDAFLWGNTYREAGVVVAGATAAGGAGEGPDTDEPTGRKDDTPLQGTATTAAAAREAGGGGGGDVTMGAVLPRSVNTAASTSNQAFLAATEAAAASQRHLLTRKCQNKPFIIL